jgi:hypothetical protein
VRRVSSDSQLGRTNVVAEGLVFATVILIAAFLTASPTSNDASWNPAVLAGETLQGDIAEDVQVGIEVAPGRAGTNFVRVQARSRRRPAPGPIGRLLLRGLSRDGEQQILVDLPESEPDVFESTVNLPITGIWDFDVVVRRVGFPDAVATFEWRLPTQGTRELRISSEPIEDSTNWALAVLFVGLAGGLLLFVRKRWQDISKR